MASLRILPFLGLCSLLALFEMTSGSACFNANYVCGIIGKEVKFDDGCGRICRCQYVYEQYNALCPRVPCDDYVVQLKKDNPRKYYQHCRHAASKLRRLRG